MELIKRNTGYGLRALIFMASHEAEGARVAEDGSSAGGGRACVGSAEKAFTAEELADAADTSADFMHKIMQALRDGGIVESKRGPGGGFRLARDPADTTLLEIVNAVQGALHVNRCVIGLDVCERSVECPLRPTWMRIQRELEDGLRGTTLADVVAASRCRVECR